MKVYYLGVLDNRQKPAVQLCAEYDLSEYSRFTRHEYAGVMRATSKIIAERTKPGQRWTVLRNNYLIHSYARSEGVAAVVITKDYPYLPALTILSKVLDEFLVIWGDANLHEKGENNNVEIAFPGLREHMYALQHPVRVNSIFAIQADLIESEVVLHDTINTVHERGEKIDDLVAKSSDLSLQSEAKGQTSCCVIM